MAEKLVNPLIEEETVVTESGLDDALSAAQRPISSHRATKVGDAPQSPSRKQSFASEALKERRKSSAKRDEQRASLQVDENQPTLSRTCSDSLQVKVTSDLALTTNAKSEQLVSRFKDILTVSGFQSSMLENQHLEEIREFLTLPSSRKLLVYVDDEQIPPVCCVQKHLPQKLYPQMMYFIRESFKDDDILTDANFEERVQIGVVTADIMDNLLKLMEQVYVPILLDKKKWPDSIRKDFNNQLHKFMAFITDSTHQLKGNTVLYVPEDEHISAAEESHSKDVIQRFESLLIHWTRQVKEVVNAQNTSETSENSGPLEEIQFWRNRCNDLSGISEQLNRKPVQRVIKILDTCKSSYLEQFQRLAKMIHEGTIQSQDNLRFLSSLTLSCTQLSEAQPVAIPALIPKILRYIRMIWANSRFYNTKDRLTSLLRKVSNEIMRRCSSTISLDEIFHGNVQESIINLQSSISCGENWKIIYKATVVHIANQADGIWDFDQSTIFAQIDAFVQRCRDLLEVCEGQIQFARKVVDGKKSPIPIFGGSRGPEIGKRYM